MALLRKIKYLIACCVFLLCCTPLVRAQTIFNTDVLVIGGGVGGVGAGIQSARMQVKTIIAEPTVWIGGMMTAAGVAAFDGNHNLPSGIWAEFRDSLYQRYGGASKVATGWVSNTLFEPHVGFSILKNITAKIPALSIYYQYRFLEVIKIKNVIKGAVFLDLKTNRKVLIRAKQVIDATELGDVMAKAGVPYDLGMEASSMTGENINIPASNNIVQDITYAAIVKDYGKGRDCTIVQPVGYDPSEFDGSSTDYYKNTSRKKPNVDAQKMLDYGKLPGNKYMLNWPIYGNDIYLNLIEMDETSRERELEKAKQQTLRFLYFIQNQLGFKHIALADDEFPTADRLPLIAYHREGRRVKGLVRFTIKELASPYSYAMYRTGIAVGDYPIDHHHKKNELAPQHLDFYPVPSFNVPLGALIPAGAIKGLIIAEKGISVSNVVNGTTRLQPCVLMIGQAAGALAALSVQQNKNAASVSVRKVQESLLQSKAYIMPYYDVRISEKHFQAAQRIGATGILRGKGIPHNWANQTLFYPDSLVHTKELLADAQPFFNQRVQTSSTHLSTNESIALIRAIALKFGVKDTNDWSYSNTSKLIRQAAESWQQWGFGRWNGTEPITRIQLAKLLDASVNPFHLMDVNHHGFFKSIYK